MPTWSVPGPIRAGRPRQVGVRPHQLPPAIPGFVGRAEALAELDRFAQPETDRPTVVVLTGMPGLGKTPAALNIDIDAEGRTVGLF